jgi:choline dehydrogenase-like flavoprotein
MIGTQWLRVVDASVFPRIPGFFITAPICMIAENARRRDHRGRDGAAGDAFAPVTSCS